MQSYNVKIIMLKMNECPDKINIQFRKKEEGMLFFKKLFYISSFYMTLSPISNYDVLTSIIIGP